MNMKIGILTHYEVNNQGAQLQMYALSSFLRSLGHETVILTYKKNFDLIPEEATKNNVSLSSVPYYIENYLIKKGPGLFAHNAMKYEKLKAFRNGYFVYEPYDSEDLDAVVIGSDEVYSIDVGINEMMYGIGINCEKKISYAPSFGKAKISDLITYNCIDMIRTGLSGMTSLSARDKHTHEMIQDLTGKEVPIVCDPVILLDFNEIPKQKNRIRKPYVLIYSYDANMKDPDEYKAIINFAQRHNLLTVSAGTYHKWCDINITCDPLEWIQYFRDAEFVITDTFHGFVTALKTEKPFAVYVRNTISPYKMRSLMEQTGTQDREFTSFTFAALEKLYMQQIDYQAVNESLNKIRTAGETYLAAALKEDNKNNNILDAYKNTYCSGCGACTSVCPVEAIDLKKNTAGFYEAAVDEEKCIHCGKCKKVCHRFVRFEGNSLTKAVPYALQSKDQNTVLSSSSGGIAYELALNAIKNGNPVTGCIYNSKTQEAEHITINAADELHLFKGSKYLQSNPKNAFRGLIDDAKENPDRQYTVFGTPCQIAGFAEITEQMKIRDRFLLVEIFCHGVPSYKLWELQRTKIEESIGVPLENVAFRDKQFGWHTYCLKAEHDSQIWAGKRENTEFWLTYFENSVLNCACMSCEARKDISKADIRLGDYWGKRYADRTDGISAVLCNTDKGLETIEDLISNGSVIAFGCGNTEEILSAQNMKGYIIDGNYTHAGKLLSQGKDIEEAITSFHKNMPLKMKAKRALLKTSALLPDDIRRKAKSIKTEFRL